MRISDWSSDVCSSDLIAVQPGQERAVRVAALLGGELADNSIAIDFARGDLTLAGVAGLPTYNRGVADHQFLFVNGRPVKDRLLVGALPSAYPRSEVRRGGNACVRTCRSGWTAAPDKKTTT